MIYTNEEVPLSLKQLINIVTRFEDMLDLPTNPNESLEVRFTYCISKVLEAKSLIKQTYNLLGK